MSYPYRVLVVEDHALQRQYVLDVLQQAGFSRVQAVDGAIQALDCLKQGDVDLILLDLDMPDMDGLLFIQQLAFYHRDTSVAICSACTADIIDSAVRMARGHQLNVLGHYAKPFLIEHAFELAHALRLCSQEQPSAPHTRSNLPPLNADMLRQAMQAQEIIAWFQPKRNLKTGLTSGVEALARWQHPQYGLISPAQFLPDITRHGLDLLLLLHMFRQAAQAYWLWREAGYVVPVSLNLPTHLLDLPSLPDDLLELATQLRLPIGDITFELLETSLASDENHLLMGAGRLRLKGFQLAQDDFGIGYSSMQTLTTVPFTELKIDRLFIEGASQNETRAAAMRSSISLGKQLGLKVTAEGVETEEDVAMLRTTECDDIQGYYVSKPVAAPELLAFLKKYN